MSANRRNYYRILHVQPEAPAQIITASYRTLMSKLKVHPDLGGDTDTAALINEAYGVLSDPSKRASYDEQRRLVMGARAPCGIRPESARWAASFATAEAVSSGSLLTECPFCLAAAPPSIGSATRCVVCASPLASPPTRSSDDTEFTDQRAMPRMSRSDSATLFRDWQGAGHVVELRNISLSGVALATDLTVKPGQVIRVVGNLFDVLAVVISARRVGPQSVLHATLRTAYFSRSQGVVVCVTA